MAVNTDRLDQLIGAGESVVSTEHSRRGFTTPGSPIGPDGLGSGAAPGCPTSPGVSGASKAAPLQSELVRLQGRSYRMHPQALRNLNQETTLTGAEQ